MGRGWTGWRGGKGLNGRLKNSKEEKMETKNGLELIAEGDSKKLQRAEPKETGQAETKKV
jgi:hypothetical protein